MPHDFAIPGDWLTLAVLFVVGGVASAINTVAGGGSLLSFPSLIGFGVPSVEANATNAASLWPGSIGGAIGFRNLLSVAGHHLKTLLPPTLIGSVLGAGILIHSSPKSFDFAVPFLILLASLMLAFQARIKSWSIRHSREVSPLAGIVIQFFVALYGGYFGAGMGLMMLASFTLYIEGTIHELNAMKVWLGLAINFAATVLFLVSGKVLLVACLAMALGGILGGYLAAVLSQKVDSEKLRIAIAVYGFAMSAYFFYRLVQSNLI